MSDRELGIVQFAVWAFLIYCLVLAVIAVWRLFLRSGDVVAQADELWAEAQTLIVEAEQVLDEHATIESFVDEWMPVTQKVAIAEAIAVDRQRDHR